MENDFHNYNLHFYFAGPAHLNNLYGMLVVREPSKTEPHDKMIDYDKSEHVVVLRAVGSYPQATILMNGRYGKAKVIFI